ncbi:VOC family protein [Streptomyces sp. NPDC059063]|uniref:VOC family protein n=1 Tax=unclassified Streptomyces TaxID=2593676 RepID=UPI0036827BD2
MTTLVRHVTVDCSDAYKLASFWAGVLGGAVADGDHPGDPEVLVNVDDGPGLLFIAVPEAKAVKNRVHLDLQPQERSRDEEVERVVALGATVFEDHRRPDGRGWVTLTDPEGNEFCVERSASELAATSNG